MRVNVYAEEITDRIEIVSKEVQCAESREGGRANSAVSVLRRCRWRGSFKRCSENNRRLQACCLLQCLFFAKDLLPTPRMWL